MRSAFAALVGVLLAAGPVAGMEGGAALRLPTAALAAADSYSRRQGGEVLLVRQYGRPLLESCAPGASATRACPVMSMTKTLAALAILAAEADGLLRLDEPAGKTLTEWRDARARITIRQLLAQTSGLAPGFPAIYGPRGRADKTRLALALPLVTRPGERFDYGPGNYEVLEEILRRKLLPSGREPVGYLRARVLTPLRVVPAEWSRDRRGRAFFSAGASLSARDLAAVGEFFCRRGRVWILPVLPTSAVEAATRGSTANPMYGLGLWLNANAPHATSLSIEGTLGQDRSPAVWRQACLAPVAPSDLVAMVGSGGLRCYIVPSRQLVIVRFGSGRNFSDAEFLRHLFGRP